MLYKLPFPQNILHKNPYVYARVIIQSSLLGILILDGLYSALKVLLFEFSLILY